MLLYARFSINGYLSYFKVQSMLFKNLKVKLQSVVEEEGSTVVFLKKGKGEDPPLLPPDGRQLLWALPIAAVRFRSACLCVVLLRFTFGRHRGRLHSQRSGQ